MKLKEFRRVSIDRELNLDIDTLVFEKKTWRFIALILVLLMFVLMCSDYYYRDKISQQRDYYVAKTKELKDSIYNYTKLNDKNILFWCNYFNVKYPKVVLAQMKLESRNFTSDLSIISNNLSGMKKARVRNTTAIYETKSGFSGYSNYIEHIKDIKMWQDFNRIDTIRTEKDYIEYLSRVYAEDKNYKNKIYKMLTTMK